MECPQAADHDSMPTKAGPLDSKSKTVQRLTGGYIWYPDATQVWKRGVIQSMTHDTVHVLSEDDEETGGKPRVFAFQDTVPYSDSHGLDLDDVAEMDNMHEAPLLHLLKTRYVADQIYTNTGDILISINPYHDIPGLYSLPPPQENQPERLASSSSPHLFQVAQKAYGEMQRHGHGQSVIISGESGAGKTEAAKLIMKYLAYESRRGVLAESDDRESDVEKKVLETNVVLEAFGNAATIRNDNSSRFGKFTKILYDDVNRITGAKTLHFLLEKSRVVQQEPHERNYHIFYQLCSGLTERERQALKIHHSAERFQILSGGQASTSKTSSLDRSSLDQTRSAFAALGFSESDIANVFSALALILHLGNLTYQPEQENNQQSDDDDDDDGGRGLVRISDGDHESSLAFISHVLQCDEGLVRERLSTRTTTSGRGSCFRIPLDRQQAIDARNALCKALYGQLFHWIVDTINTSYDVATTRAGIGILDIFGFEILEQNGFEQLCINYANEALQQQFNHHVFTLEQDNYVAEGIDWTMIEFMDNQPILDVITRKPHGIFPTLEEQCLLARKVSTDGHAFGADQFLGLIHRYHAASSSEYYAKPRIASSRFEIKHFAGAVSYDAAQFISKNNDSLHSDLLLLVQTSENAFIANLFQTAPDEPNDSNGSGILVGSSTVSSVFRQQLQSLMTTLWATRPHYIRCIKPNDEKAEYRFNAPMVLNQLRYSGVMEVVRIRRQGYPVRRAFQEFVDKYEILTRPRRGPGRAGSTSDNNNSVEDRCAMICKTFFGETTHQMGRQQIYLRDNQVQQLDGAVRKILHGAVVRIQTICRQYLARRELHDRKARWVRRRLASATLIQAYFRRIREQRRFDKFRAAVILVQSFLRTCIVIARYQDVQHSIRRVQTAVRCFLSRRALEGAMDDLKDATTSGDIQRVRGLLVRFPALRKVRYRRDEFKTIGHFAACSDCPGLATFLLSQDGALFDTDKDGNTPLHCAAAKANLVILRHLSILLHDAKHSPTASASLMLSMETASDRKAKPRWLKRLGGALKSAGKTTAASCRTPHTQQREGWLWKRRRTNHWRKRYVVVDDQELRYCKSKRGGGAKVQTVTTISLDTAMVKKSTRFAACIEVYSPELLSDRNKEGCLYFATSNNNEIEAQEWLSYLRNVINSSIDHTLRRKPIKVLDTQALAEYLSRQNKYGQNALHVLCSQPHDASTIGKEIRTAMWLVAFGADRNAGSCTPLSLCIQKGKTELAAMLLDRGAVASNSSNDKTELELASEQVLECISDRVQATTTTTLPPKTAGGTTTTGLMTYLSIYVEGYEADGTIPTHATSFKIQVVDANQNELEPATEVDIRHAYSHKSRNGVVVVSTCCTWHMRTPLEALPSAGRIVIDLSDGKGGSIGCCEMNIDERDIDTSFFELSSESGTWKKVKSAIASFKLCGERYLHRA